MPSPTSPKRFRVAFSFTGEKRDFVARVAAILANRFGKTQILYDQFHEAEFARQDLSIYLPNLYNRDADLVVVVICPDYDRKPWTGLEWLAIHDLLQQRRREEVMLSRFGHAKVEGLFAGAGFVELEKKTPEEFADVILERLKANGCDIRKRRRSIKPAAPASSGTQIPNNLSQLPYFFGRQKELDQVVAALDPRERTWIILVHGPGGIGKTSFAIRSAELARPTDYDRIVFVSSKRSELASSGQRPVRDFLASGYLEILDAIARELGNAKLGELEETRRPMELVRLLRDKRVLFVIDNLESLTDDDLGRVLEFLKNLPAGCKAIITSRRRTDAQSQLVTLESIEWEDANRLFTELEKTNPLLLKATNRDRRALYTDCGGNPLILKWVVGQLGRGQCRTAAGALQLLKQSPTGEAALEFVFGDLAKHFTEEEANLLAALSHFTLPIATEDIAKFAEVAPLAAQAALETLADRALVVGDVELKKFFLRPLVGDFLRRARPKAIRETGDRLEKRAYALIVENGYQKHERFPVLDAAWPTVAPALPQFLAGPNERLQTVCDALAEFLNYTGRWDERLALNEQAENVAAAAGDHAKAGWRANQAAWVHYLREQPDAVLACADRAAAYWHLAQSGPLDRAYTLRLQGLGYELKKAYPAAIAAYRKSLEFRRTLSSESEDVAIVLSDLADVESYLGDMAAAERYYLEALRVARAVGAKSGVATYTGNLAALAIQRKDWARAESLAREALPLSEKLGRQELIAYDCWVLAEALVRQGNFVEALPYARRAIPIYEKLGLPHEALRKTIRECEAGKK